MAIDSQQKNELKRTLFSSPEGRLLLVGAAMAFAYAFWLGAQVLLWPERSQVLVGMTATQVLFGRAAGMAFGYSLELDHTTVIPICVIIETVMVLIIYPLFVFSWRRLLVIKPLRTMFERTRRAAEARKGVVRRYGIIGLFVFVWFPFWLTGPVIGAVIGFLLGLRLWITLTTVLAGTVVAIVGWAVFLRALHQSVAAYSSYALMAMIGLLVIIIAVGHVLHRGGHGNSRNTED